MDNSKKRIAICTYSLNFGGAEKQAVLDANLLCTSKLPYIDQVYLLTFKRGELSSLLDKDIVHITLGRQKYLLTTLKLARIVKKEKIDVVHASLFAPMIISALTSMIAPVSVVWHFHSHEFDIPLRSRLAFRRLSRLSSVKKILFVNHELKEHFSSFNFPPEKLGVLYNYSTIESCNSGVEKRTELVNVGYLGRVIELKRVHYLVKLAAYLTGVKKVFSFKIHIVGDGEGLDLIRSLVVDSGLNEYFDFYGFREDVAPCYEQFDIFVNPSSEECLSMAMIDAGMMGLPIVAFDVGGNNEIVIDNKTGFIVNNQMDFFDKCLLLISNAEMRKKMGDAAREHCGETFGASRHIEQLARIYEEILHVV